MLNRKTVMTNLEPKYISRQGLDERLKNEVAALVGADLTWWSKHSLAPFSARHGDVCHFVVAASGEHVIFFADDEDEFGVARLSGSGQEMVDYGLVGDLVDAVGVIRQNAV